MRPLLNFVAFLTAFHYLFWHESLGINLFLFGLAILGYSFVTRKIKTLNFNNIFLIVLSIAGGIAVMLINTAFSKVMFFITVISTHLSLQTSSASIMEFFVNGVLNVFSFRQGLIPAWSRNPNRKRSTAALYMRIGIIPLLFFIFYFIMFSQGNSIFGDMTIDFLNAIGRFLDDIFSLPYLLFMGLGIVIIRWMTRTKWFGLFHVAASNILNRKKFPKKQFKGMDLKFEYLTALLVFALLNGLFLVVNVIDVKWVWFQFDISEVHSLKEFVHEGVGWLIFTLLVSIGVILYYFRGNLNFYPKSRVLKGLAYAWIAQNMVLAISVILRTFYYVQYHGIASKRIGVFLFLLMVLFGLLSLYHKIRSGKNFAYVVKVNSLFIVGLLGVSSLMPWNIITANINLNHNVVHQIDVDNYLDLDPQVYPLIYENLDKIEVQIKNHQSNNVRWIHYENLEQFENMLEQRSRSYLNDKKGTSIASWSLADQRAIASLEARLN